MKGEHFLPFRRRDVVAMCTEELSGAERADFGAFAYRLASLVHHRFHERIERLKDAYHPFHPEADTRVLKPLTPAERQAALAVLEEELVALARAANFTPMSLREVEEAMAGHSLLKLRLELDMRDVDTVLLFRRGESVRTRRQTRLFGLWRRQVSYVSYARVLVYAKFKEADQFTPEAAQDLLFRPGSVIVKLFQNVPRQDLEMIFPNVRVRMRLIDKLFIGVPALVSGIVVVATKLVSVLGLIVTVIAFWLGLRDSVGTIESTQWVAAGLSLFAVGGYVSRQISNFKNRKIRFMKALSENLYYRNLDNDAGVFHHLLDAAEEAEVIEAILAYHFLRRAQAPLTLTELDERVEQWFREHWDHAFDFEVDDGVRKLRELGLVTIDADERLTPVPLDAALRRLERLWTDAVADTKRPSDPAGAGAVATADPVPAPTPATA
jgi:hypothetical protein